MNKIDKVPDNCYRLAGNICVFNSLGEMLIQQRANSKNTYPNFWDIKAMVNAVSGEDSKTTVIRELKEELGIDLCEEKIELCYTISSDEWFSDIYILNKEIDISSLILKKDEVNFVKWANKNEILKMIENNEFVPYEKKIIDFIFRMEI